MKISSLIRAGDGSVWGRPAGIAVTRDGALLVSDDPNGTIFRVAPSNR
jgi:glucose/arabinose dehydrogenase